MRSYLIFPIFCLSVLCAKAQSDPLVIQDSLAQQNWVDTQYSNMSLEERVGQLFMVMVASDRISAFDHVLPRAIPYKGQVLNQIALHFMDATREMVPNWVLASPDPNVTIGMACEPFKIEMVIRGYLAGHAWGV